MPVGRIISVQKVGRIISAPVQKVGNAVSKMGKVTKAAVLATAVGAATVYGGTTNNVSQVSANNTNNAGGIVGYAQTSNTTSNISNSTNASLENNTTKALGGIGGFTLKFGSVQITSTAVSMIVGILLNIILREKKEKIETKTE